MNNGERLAQMVDADPAVVALKVAQSAAELRRNEANAMYGEACQATRDGIAKARAIHELTIEIEREQEEIAAIQQRIAELEAKREKLIWPTPT